MGSKRCDSCLKSKTTSIFFLLGNWHRETGKLFFIKKKRGIPWSLRTLSIKLGSSSFLSFMKMVTNINTRMAFRDNSYIHLTQLEIEICSYNPLSFTLHCESLSENLHKNQYVGHFPQGFC